jgi:hypothetical protein
MTAITVIAVVVLALAAATIAAQRMGYSGTGGDTVVRCRAGHLFTTLWVPGRVAEVRSPGTNQVPVLSGRKALDPRDPGPGVGADRRGTRIRIAAPRRAGALTADTALPSRSPSGQRSSWTG